MLIYPFNDEREKLLLRHYFKFIDGKTSGPSSFSGLGKQIRKQIQNNDISCLPLVQFKAITGKINPIHNAILETMNTDQKYMFEASLAVQSGYFPISLANMKPGKLHNARWLTLANRLLRLYVSTVNASKELCDIVYLIY